MKNKYEIRGDVTAIFVERKGVVYEALISTEHLPRVDEFPNKWYLRAFPKADHLYVQGEDRLGNGKRKRYILHREVMRCPQGMSVDHINHNTLDNRAENLRVVTHQQNQQNRKGAQKNNLSSGIRGVSWCKTNQKWTTGVKLFGRRIHLGLYKDVEEARSVVEKARSIMMPFSKDAKVDHERVYEELYALINRPLHKKTKSGVRNVSYCSRSNKWKVEVKINGVRKWYGSFGDFEEAKKIAQEVRKDLNRNVLLREKLLS